MFKSDQEAETLLTHPKNILHRFIGRGSNPNCGGHGNGSGSRITIQDKADIAVLATLVGNKAAAELTGENPTAVSQIKNGVDGLGRPEEGTRAAINAKLAPIQNKAIDKVGLLLDLIKTDGSEELSSKDAAVTAEKLTSIYEKLTPKGALNVERANIIFYSPKQREVSDFQIIDVEPVVG